MYDADMNFNYQAPTRIVYGVGTVAELAAELEAIGGQKAVLVTDKFLREHTDLVDKAQKGLSSRFAGVFDGTEPDASFESIAAGYEAAKAMGADSVVSLGGGSAMDTGKAIAMLLAHGGELMDHQGVHTLPGPVVPHICVPTTAGTGSEVSYVFIAKDTKDRRKHIFCDFNLTPPVALLDPALSTGLPNHLTAATAIDALTHAVEAMQSQQRQPLADMYGREAIARIATYLPKAIADNNDLQARGELLLAATMAGVSFSNAQVGLVHAMAHAIGARHGVHHGLANAICLPHVIRFNAETCPEVYADCGRAFGLAPSGEGDLADTMRFADRVESFLAEVGLPTRLSEVGVPEDDLEACAAQATEDGSIIYNARFAMMPDLVLGVFQAAF
jgi:alcohol dehydrogenase